MANRTTKPIQVYLEAQQDRSLRRIAQERGVTLSALVRISVDTWLRQLAPQDDPAMSLIDLGASSVHDLGSAHDEHMASVLHEELEAERA